MDRDKHIKCAYSVIERKLQVLEVSVDSQL